MSMGSSMELSLHPLYLLFDGILPGWWEPVGCCVDGLALTSINLMLHNFGMSWFTVKRFPLVMDQLAQLSPLHISISVSVSPIVG